ncbi:MAG: type IX secretion system PorP/SprF family membrane protein [Bacteroidia bacterium]|jgi:type IX secretion system PorP/SprF family membrane protein
MTTKRLRHILQLFTTITICSLQLNLVQAQDPEFSQFYATPVYTNPALAGTGKCDRLGTAGRASINYRNQWPALAGSFVTTAFSYDQQFDQINGGIGLIVMNDVAGEGLLTSNSISGVYAYELPISQKLVMRFGLEAQIMQRGIDWSKLRWEDQIHATRGFVGATSERPISNKITSPNFSTGWVIYGERFYGGLAVHNIIEPVQSFYGSQSHLPRRYTVHFGSVIPLDKGRLEQSTINPNALFMRQGQFTQLNFGFYMNRGPLVTGLWYRQTFGESLNSDALMILVGFKKNRFKFGYSYDLTVDSKRSAARGSHEISTAIEWCGKRPRKTYKRLICPTSF